MLQRVWHCCGTLAMLCCAMLIGCSGTDPTAPEGLEVPGRLVKDGQPASLENFEEGYNYYEVTLQPAAGNTKFSDNVKQDGSFTIRGIKPGKYKVGVAKIVTGQEGPNDEWLGKYAPQNSTVEVDVQEGQEVTVDLAQLGVPNT